MAVTVQALRRSRGLTLIDLARLSGVPARTIGAIEFGMHRLDSSTRSQLAWVFAVTPTVLHPAPPPPLLVNVAPPFDPYRAALPFATALATMTLAASLLPRPFVEADMPDFAPAIAAAPPVALAEQLREPALALAGNLIQVETIRAITLEQLVSVASVAEKPARSIEQADAPAVVIEAKDPAAAVIPRGCPLIATTGAVVITQGYGVGTHAPAATWGALDFGIDTNGDGYAEPGSTMGAPVVATHAGIARVYPGSWPGGNFVRIEARDAGWTTSYGHLDTLLVADGQEVRRGMQIGTAGNTGYSTGPHLHYEVWRQGQNVDPAPFVDSGGCS